MITAKFNLKGDLWSFRVSGHAYYGEHGHDIVCAGVSALTIAIGNKLMIEESELPKMIIPDSIDVLIGGEFAYHLTKEENAIECIAIKETFANKLLLDTLIDGLRDIETEHPKNIKVVVESE